MGRSKWEWLNLLVSGFLGAIILAIIPAIIRKYLKNRKKKKLEGIREREKNLEILKALAKKEAEDKYKSTQEVNSNTIIKPTPKEINTYTRKWPDEHIVKETLRQSEDDNLQNIGCPPILALLILIVFIIYCLIKLIIFIIEKIFR